MCATCNLLRGLLIDRGMSPGVAMAITAADGPVARAEDAIEGAAKKVAKTGKRKVSAYAKKYGQAYRRLKAKHPRAQHRTLVKRAHTEAKKLMKKK